MNQTSPKVPFSSQKRIDEKSFPTYFLRRREIENSFPMFGNAKKVSRKYHFIFFPVFSLCRNWKKNLFNFSITPLN